MEENIFFRPSKNVRADSVALVVELNTEIGNNGSICFFEWFGAREKRINLFSSQMRKCLQLSENIYIHFARKTVITAGNKNRGSYVFLGQTTSLSKAFPYAYMWGLISPVATGGFGGLNPTNKAPSSPN